MAKDTARVTVTLTNLGTAEAPISPTQFVLDGTTVLGTVDASTIPAGGTATVSVLWPTKGVKGARTITVTSDVANAIEELDESNNVGSLVVTVKGNEVTNLMFTSP